MVRYNNLQEFIRALKRSSDPCDDITRLEDASEEAIRNILLSICYDDRAIKEKAIAYLDKLDSKKRGRPVDEDVLICFNCRIAYSETENHRTACICHTGKLVIDYSMFEDWYPGEPDPDNEINRAECPEGFSWDCCHERGDSREVCHRGWHKAVESKRRRLDVDEEVGEEEEEEENEEEGEEEEEEVEEEEVESEEDEEVEMSEEEEEEEEDDGAVVQALGSRDRPIVL